MKEWWRRRSIRFRLTVWYTCTLLAILLVYGGGVMAVVWHNLSVDLDHRLREDFEVAEAMLERQADGPIRWRGEHPHEEEGIENQPSAEVWTRQGELLLRSASLQGLAKSLPKPQADGPAFGSLSLPGNRRLRVLKGPYSLGGQSVVIRVIRSEDRMRQVLVRLILIGSLGLPLSVAVAALGGYALARKALAPVKRMTEQAKTITAEHLHERLPVHNSNDELGHLAQVFNETFARLEQSFEHLRRFTADASHELRTPLTSIRSVGEVALRESRDEPAYREVIGSMLEEADRLARLVDDLLTLSRADSGRAVLHRESLDLAELAREIAEDLGILAEQNGQSIRVEGVATMQLLADRQVLRRALINLVDNAIKYSPDRSTIRLVVNQRLDATTLEVIDQGPGIPEEHQAQIFERFYRVDKARSRNLGGTGLGLAIAKWVVEAHGGWIELDSAEGRGSTFRICLQAEDHREEKEHNYEEIGTTLS